MNSGLSVDLDGLDQSLGGFLKSVDVNFNFPLMLSGFCTLDVPFS